MAHQGLVIYIIYVQFLTTDWLDWILPSILVYSKNLIALLLSDQDTEGRSQISSYHYFQEHKILCN